MIIITTGVIVATPILPQQSVSATATLDAGERKSPIAISGDNIYITWWSNKTGNDEVLFRTSTDGGATFGDKINLSNTTNMDSVDAMIDAEGDTVAVTWWERNSTSNEPVMKISNDAGETFGPLLQLSQNGTLGITDISEE